MCFQTHRGPVTKTRRRKGRPRAWRACHVRAHVRHAYTYSRHAYTSGVVVLASCMASRRHAYATRTSYVASCIRHAYVTWHRGITPLRTPRTPSPLDRDCLHVVQLRRRVHIGHAASRVQSGSQRHAGMRRLLCRCLQHQNELLCFGYNTLECPRKPCPRKPRRLTPHAAHVACGGQRATHTTRASCASHAPCAARLGSRPPYLLHTSRRTPRVTPSSHLARFRRDHAHPAPHRA